MKYLEVTEKDRQLVQAAIEVVTKNYREERHTVGAAVLCASGRMYTAVNVESVGYGPCAEPIAIGAAFSSGEKELTAVVAVQGGGAGYPVIPPCGNCRQLIWDYAPEAAVLLDKEGALIKVGIADLLPMAYRNFYD